MKLHTVDTRPARMVEDTLGEWIHKDDLEECGWICPECGVWLKRTMRNHECGRIGQIVAIEEAHYLLMKVPK